jgi:hypothetical protein
MLEKDIEKHLVWAVELFGGKAYKFTSPANRGVADRIVVLAGRHDMVRGAEERRRQVICTATKVCCRDENTVPELHGAVE